MSKTEIVYKDVAPGAVEASTITTEDAVDYSTPSALPYGIDGQKIITLEPGYWILGDKFAPLDDQPIAFWSEEMSNENCVFENEPVITVNFSQQFTSTGITLAFDRTTGDYCRKVNVKWYQQSTLKADVDFYPTEALHFCAQNVESYDKLVITLLETSLPRRRARLTKIMFGIERTFGMTDLRSARIVNEAKTLVTELPISTAVWNLENRENVDFMFQLRQPVEFYNDGNLLGVYYIDKHSRSSKGLYSITCQDAVGVLADTPFSGGVYTNYSAQQLVLDIVGTDFAVEFDDVTDISLTGVIVPSMKREALQQVLFAWGVCASTDGRESIRIFAPSDVAIEVGEDRTYTGTSTDVASIVTAVQVTAHTYTADTNGAVDVNGTKYKDTTAVYTVTNPDVTANDKQNVVKITDATLISPSIAQSVAQRVYDYYAKRATNRAKIVWSGEKLGDLIITPNVWGGTASGHIEKMEITLSNTIAANCVTIGN